MKFFPSYSKYNKFFKIRKNKSVRKNQTIVFGKYGIRALESVKISHVFIEKLNLFLKRKIKKKGKIIFRCIPYIADSRKPLEVRMGKGKGPNTNWIYPIKKGQMFMELNYYKTPLLFFILKALRMKLPFKYKLIIKKK